MIPLSTIAFFKQHTCPPSELLLSYSGASLTAEQYVWITSHLSTCDFCGAEFHLLMEHAPIGDEEYTVADIPAGLRCLAESLLCRETANLNTLTEMFSEQARLTLTDA